MRDCVLMAQVVVTVEKIPEQDPTSSFGPKASRNLHPNRQMSSVSMSFLQSPHRLRRRPAACVEHTVLCCHCSVDKTKEHWLSCVLLRKDLQPACPRPCGHSERRAALMHIVSPIRHELVRCGM